jgi:hypothetical protein
LSSAWRRSVWDCYFSAVVVAVHVSVLEHAGAMWRDEVNTINLATSPSLVEIWQQNLADELKQCVFVFG